MYDGSATPHRVNILAFASRQGSEGGMRMRTVGYLIGMVGVLLVFTVRIGQAHRGAMRRRRVQRMWADKRDEWLQHFAD